MMPARSFEGNWFTVRRAVFQLRYRYESISLTIRREPRALDVAGRFEHSLTATLRLTTELAARGRRPSRAGMF
jgi:hypothetical protein